MSYTISKSGYCAKHLCHIDEERKIACTSEDGIMFDFSSEFGWTLKGGADCMFKTGSGCRFESGFGSMFKTGSSCTFKTDSHCIFYAGYSCVFECGHSCTFKAGHDCTFKVGGSCSLIRYDDTGVIELPARVTIRLNGHRQAGYKVKTIEWVRMNMDNEDGMILLMKEDEFFDPSTLKVCHE